MAGESYALDRVAPAHVLSAAGLVGQGRVYDLGLVLGADVPQGVEGEFQPYTFRWTHLPDPAVPPGEYQYSAEAITCTPHIGTHIDGLAHVASGSTMHGGASVDELRTDWGFRRYGMETVPPIVTRAAVFDVAGQVTDPLPDGYEVTVEDLEACGVPVRPGDTVLVRTGKVREYAVDNQAYQRAQPGVGRDAAIWLYEQGMVALGTDTTGTEPLPFQDATRTTHQAMLVERGVHLIENLYLEELAADAVQAAMFVCLPLRIAGATGSWVRPVAIV